MNNVVFTWNLVGEHLLKNTTTNIRRQILCSSARSLFLVFIQHLEFNVEFNGSVAEQLGSILLRCDMQGQHLSLLPIYD